MRWAGLIVYKGEMRKSRYILFEQKWRNETALETGFDEGLILRWILKKLGLVVGSGLRGLWKEASGGIS